MENENYEYFTYLFEVKDFISAVQFNIDDTQGHDLKLLSPHATLAPYLLHLQNIVSPQPSSVCSVGIRGEPDNNN
ncbi:unnamed protein product [Schistosoma intercalatum]|nr:unnamed protein product [Schistosoma intercalatum]